MKLILGNSLEKLKELEDNSVDSIITDPPYHLVSIVKRFGKKDSAPAQYGKDGSFGRLSKGFMGKEWDGVDENGIGIAYNVDLWAECLRVLKPGGHLLAFSGTRTYHRMAVAIEDAGFEVRDMIEWVYGSGFPKSLNIGKAVDKQDTADFRKKIGTIIKNARNAKSLTMDELCQAIGLNDIGHGGMVNHYENGRATPTVDLWLKICEVLNIDTELDYIKEKTDRLEVIGQATTNKTVYRNIGQDNISGQVDLTKPKTEEAKQWEGWGTALKPAHEPICMARKPITEKNIAENVLKYGTGGINIDESRVEEGGRFPANLIHDNSDEVKECFPETKTHPGGFSTMGGVFGNGSKTKTICSLGDSGSASRFFKSIIYQAKASKSERNKGCEKLPEIKLRGGGGRVNNGYDRTDPEQERLRRAGTAYGAVKAVKNNFHPTVKPIALMEYLIKMITPKGGVVLDPFMGSGSTGVAAKKNGYDFIGIDMTPEYVKIAKARINATEIENRLL